MMNDMNTLSASYGHGGTERAKKYHEGWAHHQSEHSKDWNKFWVVLRGAMLFIFENESTHRNTSKKKPKGLKKPQHDGMMVGTLTINQETECKNLSGDSKKKGYRMELITVSAKGERKVNKFKFPSQNERDLWKSFIVGIAQGIIPSDVHLLPGQLKNVHEAMAEVRDTPPPLPSIPRPSTLLPRPKILDDHSTVRSNGSVASSDSGSFQSHVTSPRTGRSMSVPSDTEDVTNLRQLMRRQSDLAFKALDTTPRGGTQLGTHPEEPSSPMGFNRENSAPVFRNYTEEPAPQMLSGLNRRPSVDIPGANDFRTAARTPFSPPLNMTSGHKWSWSETSGGRSLYPVGHPAQPPRGPFSTLPSRAPERRHSAAPQGWFHTVRPSMPAPPSQTFSSVFSAPQAQKQRRAYSLSHVTGIQAAGRSGEHIASWNNDSYGQRKSSLRRDDELGTTRSVNMGEVTMMAKDYRHLPGRVSPTDYDHHISVIAEEDEEEEEEEPVYAVVNKADKATSALQHRKGGSVDSEESSAESYGSSPSRNVRFHREEKDTWKGHLFFANNRSGETPSWFFDDCSRDEAEGVLTVGRKYGNVLMRPSSNHKDTGKYVISMRREVSGGTQLNHYSIAITSAGFKIDVDNKHSPMRCLSDVMDFFVSVAGPGTRPMICNDTAKIYGKDDGMKTLQSPQASSAPFGHPSWSSSPSTFTRQPSHESQWNSPPPPPSSHNTVLKTRGNVSNAIQHAVQEMNQDSSRVDRSDSSGVSHISVSPPAPPPCPAFPEMDDHGYERYGNVSGFDTGPSNLPPDQRPPSYLKPQALSTNPRKVGFADDLPEVEAPPPPSGRRPPATLPRPELQRAHSEDSVSGNRYFPQRTLNAPVPVRSYPSETVMRNQGHIDTLNQGFNSLQINPPVPPPPPPIESIPSHPPSAPAAPPLPSFPNHAPPTSPPFAPPTPPAATPFAAPPHSSHLQSPVSPAFPSSQRKFSEGQGYGATPALSFEEELAQRLKPKREQIYADATILTSN